MSVCTVRSLRKLARSCKCKGWSRLRRARVEESQPHDLNSMQHLNFRLHKTPPLLWKDLRRRSGRPAVSDQNSEDF